MSFDNDIKFVAEIARGAGKIILSHYGKVERQTKTHQAASSEAVTIADRASQAYIVKQLRKRFPNDGIVGEENETGDNITFDCPNPRGRVWVIDPIDGTNNFIAGFDYFAVCIGLLENGRPVGGVVYDVCRDRMYSAAKGSGAKLNGKKIEVLRTPMDEQSLLIVTSNFLDKNQQMPAYPCRWLGQTKWKVRCLGSAALDAMQVAAGAAHAAVTINGKLWDVAAPAAIVLEAGGKLTALDGTSVFPFNLADYCGAKVPFIAAGPKAIKTIVDEVADGTMPKIRRR